MTRVQVGAISIEIPAQLSATTGVPIDSISAVLTGEGLTVIIDQGPFADRLEGAVGRPDFREVRTDMAGASGRTVYFRSPEEHTYTFATVLSETHACDRRGASGRIGARARGPEHSHEHSTGRTGTVARGEWR